MGSLAKISSLSAPELRSRYASAVGTMARYRAKAEEGAERGVTAAVGVSAAALGGVLQAKMPVIPGTEIPSDAAAGLALGVGSVLGMFGKRNDLVMTAAIALLASPIAQNVRERLS
jgi:hypothetical protein